ncbi:MAG: hypothetical protein JWN64_229 [Parcubacteria group bacterium]|nr:hypothetical protein [Parcubacteria group bacterium]
MNRHHPTWAARMLLLKKAVSLALLFSFILSPFGTVVQAEERVDTPDPTEQGTDINPGTEVFGMPNPDLGSTENNFSETLDSGKEVNPETIDGKGIDPPVMESALLPGVAGYIANEPIEKAKLPEADRSSGALVYRYEITAPPGRNGMEPKHTLTYSSQDTSVTNTFGQGWSIDIPYIQRTNKTGVEDMYSGNYFYSSLSGDLATSTASTTYYAKADNGDFIKYEFSNNQWLATDKAGKTYKYGYATSTRQDNATSTAQVYKWMLEEVRDANDNYVKYSYYKDSGQIYPASISYTGNGSTDGDLSLEFTRSTRTDVATSTTSGFPVTSKYYISQIQAKVGGIPVHTYALSYTNGDDGAKKLLQSVTESGTDESSATTTLPAIEFTYATSTRAFVASSTYSIPEIFSWNGGDRGMRPVDINNDGYVDLLKSYDDFGTQSRAVYLNNHDGTGWTASSTLTIPEIFVRNNGSDEGVRFVDINGDQYPDLLHSYSNPSSGSANTTYLNNKMGGWILQASSTIPEPFSNSSDVGTRFGDVNGDGNADLLRSHNDGGTIIKRVYLNNGDGTGWTQDTNYTIPVIFADGTNATRLVDINSDGLIDIVISYTDQYGTINRHVYLNKGDGTGWAEETSWVLPASISRIYGDDLGVRFMDINADGMVDFVQSRTGEAGGTGVWLNTGTGFATTTDYTIPYAFNNGGTDQGVFIEDIDSDGVMDFLKAMRQDSSYTFSADTNATSLTDLITRIKYPEGGTTDVTYRTTAQYKNGSGSLLNPSLRQVIPTVANITNSPGSGTTVARAYEYAGGAYYFGNTLDKRFAGFNTISETNAQDFTTVNYYHQGTSTDTAHGEYDDHVSKIGKVYQTEVYDDSDNLYSRTINKWDRYAVQGDHNLVKLIRSMELSYDGDVDHSDKASTYTYDDTNGNLTQEVNWGSVTGSTDGSFTDAGSDKTTRTIAYATSTGAVIGLPSTDSLQNQASTTVSTIRHYYDTLSLGTALKGNETKTEKFATSTSYIDEERTYNSYGLVTTSLDPRNLATTYAYDLRNLYVATTTNAKGHIQSQTYDYSSGKVATTTDPNGRKFVTVYDGLDRPIIEKQPDIATPSTLVTKKTYAYTDTSGAKKLLETNYLDASNTSVLHTYYDGLNRQVQMRKEAEGGSQFAVKDIVYDGTGQIAKESLPYFSSGSTKTSALGNDQLYTIYTYDPMKRVVLMETGVGDTETTYDQWTTSVTDPEGNTKDFEFDASGNLIQVIEHNGSAYTTAYTYDAANNLTRVTDAEGNVRNFTYDGLRHRLSAQDLHDSGDATFGVWTYTYDAAGNVASTTDPKGQVVQFTYDDINRPLTEDFTGTAGTEIAYAYDTCTEGMGRLCAATTTDAVTNLQYDALGRVKSEARAISSSTLTTLYEYDRQGNLAYLTYPDSSQVRYLYNDAGLLESVAQKESGGSFADVVSDFDYAPTEKVTYKAFANGAETTNTYSAGQLYRLTNIRTVVPEMEGLMSGGGEESSMDEAMIMDQVPEPVSAESPLTYVSLGKLAMASDAEIKGLTEAPARLSEVLEELPMLAEESSVLEEESPIITEEAEIATSTESIDLQVEEDASIGSDEVLSENIGTTTPMRNALELLPVDAAELKIKTPVNRLLGAKSIGGMTKYAYQTDTKVDSLPVGEATLARAEEAGLQIEEEVLKERTKNARTFATDQDGVFVAEIVAGDPQYYEDENGEWWLAEYGLTTKASYEYQVGQVEEKKEELIEEPLLEVEESKKDVPGEVAPVPAPVNEIIDEGPEEIIPSLPPAEEAPATATPEESLVKKMVNKIMKIAIAVGQVIGIVPLRVYATDLTFYPDPNIEVNTVDGYIRATASTWSGVRNSTSGTSNDSGTTIGVSSERGTTSGNSYILERGVVLFNTTSIPAGVTVTAATLNLYVISSAGSGSTRSTELVEAYPAYNTSLRSSDFGRFSDVHYGSSDGTYTLNTYEPIALNSTGIAHVATRGITMIGLKGYHDRVNVSPSNTDEMMMAFSSADQSGTTQDPKLVVIYSVVPTTPTSLLAEGQTNPIDIIDNTPEFSAIHQDPDTGEAATHYEIQVATSTSFTSPYWDSTKTALASSTPAGMRIADVPYTGSGLASSTTYYWRIKFWDAANNAGPWSATPATFSIRLSFPPTAPTSMQVDAQTNPTGLQNLAPDFSAIYNDYEPAELATSYQVQVSSTPGVWTSPKWDSGPVAVASSTPVGQRVSGMTYTGPALLPTETYYWRVKFWDNHSNEGAWSTATSTFSTGVLSTGNVIQNTYFIYDDVGNILQINDYSETLLARQVVYGYDDLYRLTTASTTGASTTPFSQTYTYSSIGNITSKSDQGTYTYAETGYTNPHAATGVASTTLGYDADGNLTSDGTKTYVWDYRNRMASSTVAGINTTYAYDHTTQRVKKTVGGISTYYPNQYFEKANATTTKYIWAGGELVATVEANGVATSTSYIHPDYLGSTNAVTNSSGVAESVKDYMPYGSERTSVGHSGGGRGYIGQFEEGDNLSYLNARFYKSDRGQFLSQDPVFWEIGQTSDGKAILMNPQAMNSYGYAGNNPISQKDPNGRMFGFDTFANSRPAYTSQQVESSGYQNLPYYYRQEGDPSGSVRVNSQKFQDLGTLAGSTALLLAGGRGSSVAAESAVPGFRYTQTTISPVFSQRGSFNGQSLNSVISGVKTGEIPTSQLPVNYVEVNGVRFVDNNRSAYVLQQAGIPTAQWNWISADQRSAASIIQKLQYNKLPNEGASSVRVTNGSNK